MLGKATSGIKAPPQLDAHNKNKKQFPIEVIKQKSFVYENKQANTTKPVQEQSMKIMEIN